MAGAVRTRDAFMLTDEQLGRAIEDWLRAGGIRVRNVKCVDPKGQDGLWPVQVESWEEYETVGEDEEDD